MSYFPDTLTVSFDTFNMLKSPFYAGTYTQTSELSEGAPVYESRGGNYLLFTTSNMYIMKRYGVWILTSDKREDPELAISQKLGDYQDYPHTLSFGEGFNTLRSKWSNGCSVYFGMKISI